MELVSTQSQVNWTRDAPRKQLKHTQDLLHLHNAGIGPDVVDRLSLLDVILLIEDISKGEVGLGRGVIHGDERSDRTRRYGGGGWARFCREDGG